MRLKAFAARNTPKYLVLIIIRCLISERRSQISIRQWKISSFRPELATWWIAWILESGFHWLAEQSFKVLIWRFFSVDRCQLVNEQMRDITHHWCWTNSLNVHVLRPLWALQKMATFPGNANISLRQMDGILINLECFHLQHILLCESDTTSLCCRWETRKYITADNTGPWRTTAACWDKKGTWSTDNPQQVGSPQTEEPKSSSPRPNPPLNSKQNTTSNFHTTRERWHRCCVVVFSTQIWEQTGWRRHIIQRTRKKSRNKKKLETILLVMYILLSGWNKTESLGLGF